MNPATEEVICSVAEATEKDVDVAVAAARKAFETTWSQTTPQERSVALLKLAELVEKNLELLAAVESLDNGKSIAMARGDVGAVVGCIRYYGGWADKIEGKTIDIAPDMFHYTRHEPVSQDQATPPQRMAIAGLDTLLTVRSRLVFAVKLSRGTSLFSCLHGRLDPPWPPATPSS